MRRMLTIASVVILTVAPGSAAFGAADNTVEAGHQLAEKLCSRCHAIGKTGDSPFKPAPPFRTLSSKYHLEDLEEALAEGITVGHEEMPEFTFSPDQIDGLIAYLRTLR